ncbi:paired box protein 6 homolog [Chionomys nivalis]|uniref:paired box protein 6 homolog n=1 Tax=Chionomys nivalis TaxID=269649 RepID=UPI002592DE60|nr:paired box protein 6 homolog [Chionomys nivalis]
MEHPHKFEHKNSNLQNLEGAASLEKGKGVGVVAPTMKNDEEKKGYGDQNQPTFEAAAEVQKLRDDIELQAICTAFSRLQLRELDCVFQRTQYPNVFGRKELGTPVNVEPEAESCEPEASA